MEGEEWRRRGPGNYPGRPRKTFAKRGAGDRILYDKTGGVVIEPGTSAIYVISSNEWGVLKVGRSRNVVTRFRDIQNGNPTALTIEWCARAPERKIKELETEVHRVMTRAFNRRVGEWYEAQPRAVCIGIQKTAERLGIELKPDPNVFREIPLDEAAA